MTAAPVRTDWLPASVLSEIDDLLALDVPHVVVLGRRAADRGRTARAVAQRLAERHGGDVAVLTDEDLLGDTARLRAAAEEEAPLVLVPGTPTSERLAAIPPDLLSTCAVLRLRPWTARDLTEYLARDAGEAPDPALVDALMQVTDGHQIHLRHVVPLVRARPDADVHDPDLWDGVVVRQTTPLGPEARVLLEELSLGFRILGDPLAPSLEDDGVRGQLVEELDDHAFLGRDGELLPFVRSTVRHGMATHRLRRMSHQFLDRVGDPRPHAETIAAMVAEGVRCPDLADLARDLGDHAADEAPAQALAWYDRAERAGTPGRDLGGRRALALVRLGDLDGAAHASDLVLVLGAGGSDTEETARAVSAALVAHVGRGMVSQARDLALWADGTAAAPAEVDVITVCRAAGDPGGDELPLGPISQGRAPTLGRHASRTAIEGIRDSLSGHATEAVAELDRAARLLPPDRPGVSPFPIPLLAGWAALHSGDPRTAEALAQTPVGAVAPHEVERTLLIGWARLWQGDHVEARARADRAAELLDPSQTRNRLVLEGLRAGIARRATDDAATAAAWRACRDLLRRVEPDLFLVLPLSELNLAAVRMREESAIRPVLEGAERLLADLGSPPLWATPLHWSCVQAAILTGRPSDIQPHARALLAAAEHHPFARHLAAAGRAWLHVLARDFDAEEVRSAATGLADISQSWDGARLAAHAAARCADRREGASLLELARSLRGDRASTPVDTATPEAPGTVRLTERELEMVRLVLEGKTYREVGGTLFLSARTVEHTIARIRRRSGAGSRRELLEQLRLTVQHLDAQD